MTALPIVSFGLLDQDALYSANSYRQWGTWNRKTGRLIAITALIQKWKGTDQEIPYIKKTVVKKGTDYVILYRPRDIREEVKAPIVIFPPQREIKSQRDKLIAEIAALQNTKATLVAQKEILKKSVAAAIKKTEEVKLPFTLEQIQELSVPKEKSLTGGIYFLLQGACLVYVGVSNKLTERLQDHDRNPNKIFDRVFIIKEPKRDRQLLIEQLYIKKYRPEYNINHNDGGPHQSDQETAKIYPGWYEDRPKYGEGSQ